VDQRRTPKADSVSEASTPPREPASLDAHHDRITEKEVEQLIQSDDAQALDKLIAGLHPADLAALFQALSPRLWPRLVGRLTIGRISDLMAELPDLLRDDLAAQLRPEQLTEAIEEMASDDAADVLADLPEPLARRLIESLSRQERKDVEELLKYAEDTAGGLMQTELVSVLESQSVESAVRAIRAKAEDVGDFHFVYVVDDQRRLVGVLNLRELILAAPGRPICELMQGDPQVVTPDVDQEDVAHMFSRYDLVALPVVDTEGRLLGRILHDDAVDVLEEEAEEDIFQMAGTSGHEIELVYTDQPLKIAMVRLPWLLATLAGLTVPALLVWKFQVSFPHMHSLVPFIPVIGAMGGNVGAQSSTIVVRGFATGRMDYHNLRRFLSKELLVGVLMGLVCGVAAGLGAIFWHDNPLLSMTVSLSMMTAIVAAAIMGVTIPYLFRLLRVDPAIAAGPLVTTLNDMSAITIYYIAARLLIGGS
jgi:magnesium transporter